MGILQQQCQYSTLQLIRNKYIDEVSINVFHIKYINVR